MKKFDPTKPVQTRDGRKARIICSDRMDGRYPIVALVTEIDSQGKVTENCLSSFSADGTFADGSRRATDLVNIPEKVERWVNIYEDDARELKFPTCAHYLYLTKEEAEKAAKFTSDRKLVTTIKIEWEE